MGSINNTLDNHRIGFRREAMEQGMNPLNTDWDGKRFRRALTGRAFAASRSSPYGSGRFPHQSLAGVLT